MSEGLYIKRPVNARIGDIIFKMIKTKTDIMRIEDMIQWYL